MTRAQDFAEEYVAAFNSAVTGHEFAAFLMRFDDDAVMRFENVPGVGTLEFAGRRAYTAAYDQQPPDDQISIADPVRKEGLAIVIPFNWRRDGASGVLRLTLRGGRIARLVVTFAAAQ